MSTESRSRPARPRCSCCATTSPRRVCLSQIKSEHIGDAVRPGPDGKEYARLCEHGVMSVHPYPTISACAPPGLHRREAEGARHVPLGQGATPARPKEPHIQGRIDPNDHPVRRVAQCEGLRAALFTRKTQPRTHRKAAILLPAE